MTREVQNQSLGVIKIVSFAFVLVIIFSLFVLSMCSGVVAEKALQNLLPLLSVAMIISVLGLWLILPLYIKKNFAGTLINGLIAAFWAYILSVILFVSTMVFFLLFSGQRGSGFSENEVFMGFLSSLMLVDAVFFLVSQVVRRFSGLDILRVEYIFGAFMLLLTGLSGWGVVYLLVKAA